MKKLMYYISSHKYSFIDVVAMFVMVEFLSKGAYLAAATAAVIGITCAIVMHQKFGQPVTS